MINGNARIGQRAPEFETTTTMGYLSLNHYKGKRIVFFYIQEILPPIKSYNLGKYNKDKIQVIPLLYEVAKLNCI